MSYFDDKPDLHRKWMDVYNSIIRLKFYTYLETTNSELLKNFDTEFSNFVRTHLNINDLTFAPKPKHFLSNILQDSDDAY